MVLAATVFTQVVFLLEPAGALDAVVGTHGRSVLLGDGVDVLGELAGVAQVGMDLVDCADGGSDGVCMGGGGGYGPAAVQHSLLLALDGPHGDMLRVWWVWWVKRLVVASSSSVLRDRVCSNFALVGCIGPALPV